MSKVIDDKLFSAVYKHSPIGLAIFNDKMDLVDVNDHMFSLFPFPPIDYKGKKFGEVFRCGVLTPGGPGCSLAEECESCTLMEGVWRVLAEERPFIDSTVCFKYQYKGANSRKWFRVSASPILMAGKKYAVASFVDVTNEKFYEDALKNKLTLDMMTGTDMQSLMGLLKDLAGYNNEADAVSMGLIDFDNFGKINELHGQEIGNDILSFFAETAGQTIRKQDIIGKYGDDGFIFIFPGVDIHNAYKIIKRMHETIKKHFADKISTKVTFSAGFLELDKKKLEAIAREDIIHMAEKFLADAKGIGKHRFVSEKMVVVL